ncbi:type IV secretion system DNA-binding domain-containing protein [Patescibacteria group bacterium]|nr:type IV secretion system DNA-binding domain-containing protein [Patescibacteria group bacterium]
MMFEILIAVLQGIVSVFTYFWWVIVIILLIFAWQNRRKAEFVEKQESSILKIKIPRTNDKDPTAAEMMFATLHGILKPKNEHIKEGTVQDHIAFEIVANTKAINFFVWMPKNIKDFVEGQIYAQYPSADITEVSDYTKELENEDFTKERSFAGAELELTKADYLPIKTFKNFQVDPLAGITGVLSKLEEEGEEIWIQILARPVDDDWKKPGLNFVKSKKSGNAGASLDFGAIIRQPIELIKDFIYITFVGPLEAKDGGKDGPKLSSEEESVISGIEEKSEKLAYEAKIRLVYIAKESTKSKERIQATIGAFKQYNTTNLNGFKGRGAGPSMGRFLSDYKNRLFLSDGYHLNIEELASIYHLPHTSVETPNISWTTFKTAEPPTNLPTAENSEPDDIALFAETNFRTSKPTVFGIRRDDRRRHMYIIGKTGMGKTKLMENLIINDIKNGEGVALIDPHGESFEFILNRIPKERLKDVVIFNPADTKHPVAFNPMEVIDESLKIQTASGIVGTFKKIFGYSWGPRLEYIFNYTVLALLDTEGATLLGVVRMLTDKKYRAKIVDNVKDPVVKKFWTDEFATYNDKFASEAIAPILNKVGQFISNSLIRNVIGQPKSSFNIRELMDNQKIFLINLSVGRIGETNATLLGSFMITAIHLAAMSRANVSEETRKDFYFYVDEFQNFATESFNNILSEARKYRLNLIVANQYLAQIEESGVKDAVFGNIGTMITFRVGAADANELAQEFNPPFEAQDIINLPKQHIYLKMIIDGQAEAPFSAKALTVDLSYKSDFVQEIIENSRKHFATPLSEVEDIVSEWVGMSDVVKRTADERSGKVFEDEIVEKIITQKDRKQGNKVDNKKLSEIIKENTGQPKPSPIEINKNNKSKNESIPGNLPKEEGRVQDRIDKETLSAILENVLKPNKPATNKENTEAPKVNQKESNPHRKNIIKNVPSTISSHKKQELSPTNNKPKKQNRVVIEPPKDSPQNKLATTPVRDIKDNTGVDFPIHNKREKVITAENFKNVKEIHPHEVVTIKESTPKDIKEGEQINFK